MIIVSLSSPSRRFSVMSPTTISAGLHVDERPFDTSDRLLRWLVGEIQSKLTVRLRWSLRTTREYYRSRGVHIYKVCLLTCPRILFFLNTASSILSVKGLFRSTQLCAIQSCTEHFQDAHICASSSSKLFSTSILQVLRPTLLRIHSSCVSVYYYRNSVDPNTHSFAQRKFRIVPYPKV